MLGRRTLPAELWQVQTFVRVLGGTDEDRQRWAAGWWTLKIATADRPATA